MKACFARGGARRLPRAAKEARSRRRGSRCPRSSSATGKSRPVRTRQGNQHLSHSPQCRDRTLVAKAAPSPSSPSRGGESVVSVVAKMFASPLAFGVACIPLIVATAVAFAVKKQVLVTNFLVQSVASVLVIVWLNITNDVFDSETGVDVEKHESVVNRTGKRDALFWVASSLLVAGIGLFIGVVLHTGQGFAGAMLLGSVCIGYIYQGPPFRLSYKGLGEILCFFAFGPLATNAFFLIQSNTSFASLGSQPLALWTSVLLGLTTSNILLNSHYHQVETDSRTEKMSPAVRFGTKWVSRAVCAIVFAVHAIHLGCLATGVMPRTALLALLSAPSASHLCRFVLENHENKGVIKPAKFLAVKWHKNFALLLALGYFLC